MMKTTVCSEDVANSLMTVTYVRDMSESGLATRDYRLLCVDVVCVNLCVRT